MIKKILLINPNTRWFGLTYWHDLPYGLCILKATLQEKYQAKILDANFENLNEEELKKRIAEYDPDIVGITCVSMESRKTLLKTAELSKAVLPDVPVVIGGVYPTLLPEQLINDPFIDYVLIGDGELKINKLINHINNNTSLKTFDGLAYKQNKQIYIQETASYIEDLDSIPYPDYSDLDFQVYASQPIKYSFFLTSRRFPYARIMSSRGCPFDCIFCSSKITSGRRIRYKSADFVLGEIDVLVKKHKVKEIIFLDDNLLLNRKRFKEILYGLIERNYDLIWKSTSTAVYALDNELLELMRKSGCYQITFSIESGSKEVLALMKKPLKSLDNVPSLVNKACSLGFEVIGGFIFGLPGETWEQIRKTFQFAESLELDYCSFNIAQPLPKTELLEICKRDNLLVNDFSFDDSNFKGFGMASIITDEFTPEELVVLRAFEWDRINFKNKQMEKKVALMAGITLKELRD